LTPDSLSAEHPRLESEWLKQHPAITEEEREKMREDGAKKAEFLTRFRETNRANSLGSEG
jgi:hypothetical protein